MLLPCRQRLAIALHFVGIRSAKRQATSDIFSRRRHALTLPVQLFAQSLSLALLDVRFTDGAALQTSRQPIIAVMQCANEAVDVSQIRRDRFLPPAAVMLNERSQSGRFFAGSALSAGEDAANRLVEQERGFVGVENRRVGVQFQSHKVPANQPQAKSVQRRDMGVFDQRRLRTQARVVRLLSGAVAQRLADSAAHFGSRCFGKRNHEQFVDVAPCRRVAHQVGAALGQHRRLARPRGGGYSQAQAGERGGQLLVICQFKFGHRPSRVPILPVF